MKTKNFIMTIFAGLLAIILFVSCDKDDKDTAILRGKVIDKETGSPLSDVTIVLQGTNLQAVTKEDGTYRLGNVKPGNYRLKAKKEGYGDYVEKGIQLASGRSLSLDIEMERAFGAFQITDKKGEVITTLDCYGMDCSFELVNIGNVFVQWSIEANADWLTDLWPEGGFLEAGASETIRFNRKLQEEDKETVLTIRSTQGMAETQLKIVGKGFKMDLVYVEGGEFEMGATPEQESLESDEKPVRTVHIDSYYIGKYEVTQAQWKAVMGTTDWEERTEVFERYGLISGDNYPMFWVNFNEAYAFCKKLKELFGKEYVLPTEAQWEYAARGGNKSQHYKYAGSDNIDEVAWYYGNSGYDGSSIWGQHPVGMKRANELGIHDMSGNVEEWCSDYYGAYDENDTDNPQGLPFSPSRYDNGVVRGGHAAHDAYYCRVAKRGAMHTGNTSSGTGFRVAVLR